MIYMARCPDCNPVIMRKFTTLDERDSWVGPHIDITQPTHRVQTWEIDPLAPDDGHVIP